jgi:hypothetical protein
MNVKNYTSVVEAVSSMANIEKWLIEIGASNINKTYKDKICTGITFLYFDLRMKQTIAFHLKAQVEECFKIFWIERTQKTEKQKDGVMKQANKTAWKILSDWAEIQCSMIILGQATPLQMFLPFVYDVKNEETLYDKITNGKLNLLTYD